MLILNRPVMLRFRKHGAGRCQCPFINGVGKQRALEIDLDDMRQVGVTCLTVKLGPGKVFRCQRCAVRFSRLAGLMDGTLRVVP